MGVLAPSCEWKHSWISTESKSVWTRVAGQGKITTTALYFSCIQDKCAALSSFLSCFVLNYLEALFRDQPQLVKNWRKIWASLPRTLRQQHILDIVREGALATWGMSVCFRGPVIAALKFAVLFENAEVHRQRGTSDGMRQSSNFLALLCAQGPF